MRGKTIRFFVLSFALATPLWADDTSDLAITAKVGAVVQKESNLKGVLTDLWNTQPAVGIGISKQFGDLEVGAEALPVKIVFATRRAKTDEIYRRVPRVNHTAGRGRKKRMAGCARNRGERGYDSELVVEAQKR